MTDAPKSRLRIDFDDETGKVKVVLTTCSSVPGGPEARVSFDLNFNPDESAPAVKTREDEDEAAYAARAAKELPSQLDLSPELVKGIKTKCREIIAAAKSESEYYAKRAAAVHALDAAGELPEGVTKRIRVGQKQSKPKANKKFDKK